MGKVPHFLVVMLGAPESGKTALVQRYINGVHTPEYEPTLETTYEKMACLVEGTVRLSVVDVGGDVCMKKGKGDATSLSRHHVALLHRAHAVVVCYSVLKRNTFEEV